MQCVFVIDSEALYCSASRPFRSVRGLQSVMLLCTDS